MSVKYTRETGRFQAKADSGKIYTIIEYQGFVDAGTFDDPNAVLPGLKRFLTTNGLTVNYINPTTFQILETNETVRKV